MVMGYDLYAMARDFLGPNPNPRKCNAMVMIFRKSGMPSSELR